MSVWVLRLKELPPGEAEEITLPLPPLPDMRRMNQAEIRAALKAKKPELAPETAAREAEQIHLLTHRIGTEDIVALHDGAAVRFAQAAGPVMWRSPGGEEGNYVLPVRLFAHGERVQSFARHADLFAGNGLREVENAQARAAIRERLPLKGARFRRLKWLAAAIMALNMIFFLIHLVQNL